MSIATLQFTVPFRLQWTGALRAREAVGQQQSENDCLCGSS
jgi:hypothetical protein